MINEQIKSSLSTDIEKAQEDYLFTIGIKVIFPAVILTEETFKNNKRGAAQCRPSL